MKLTIHQKSGSALALLLCLGSLAPPTAGQSSGWLFVAIHAPTQPVTVQTPRDRYNANFENGVLVFPNGTATGRLELSQPEDSSAGSNQGFGRWEVNLGHVLVHDNAVVGVLLRARKLDVPVKPTTGIGEITIILYPETLLRQDCLIYDLLGSQLHARFEAHARISIFRE